MALIDKLPDFIKSSRFTRKLAIDEACRAYSGNGGILRTEKGRLIFPDKDRLIEQMTETAMRKDSLTEQIRFWHRLHRDTASSNTLTEVARLTDPLYWEHMLKMATEKDYRDAFEKVALPMRHMSDNKYRKIVETFVNNPDYRRRLVEAKTSEMGRAGDTIKESADKNLEFKKKIIEGKLEKLKEERMKVADKLQMLDVLLKWSLEGEIKEERSSKSKERH